MRILVTNDDGVGAPGLAALTRSLVAWAERTGGDADADADADTATELVSEPPF